MRVDISNLAAANFNFPSIISSKSLFAENPTGSPAESQSRSIREQKYLRVNLEKLSAVEKEKSTRPLITHRVNLDETKCSSSRSRRKMRRSEKRRMKEVEASFESSVLCV
jgi:hypothetical protein